MLIKRLSFSLLPLIAFVTSIVFFSFSSPRGGDRFEIYLNKKLVFQEFVGLSKSVKSFQLDRTNYNGEVDVVYSHCGEAGKSRILKITDAKNQVLKQWSFGNGKDHKASMNFKVKDVLLAQKDKSLDKLLLYYTSEQLPQGKLLASIVLADLSTKP